MKKNDPPRPRKPSTFDSYIAERSAQIERIIEHTLRVVDATKYGNLTEYCKALAVVITEIRAAKAGDPSTPFYNKRVRPFSFITLLRNENYRHIVEGMFKLSRGTLEQPEAVSEEAMLKIASLQSQVNLLKDRLSGISTAAGSNALDDAGAQENLAKLREYLTITVDVYTKMRMDLKGALKSVSEPNEKYRICGLYSAYGLIADVDSLQKIEEGRRFLDSLSKTLKPTD